MNHPRSGFAAPPQGGAASAPAKPAARRLRDWQSRLSTVVSAAARRPFAWGTHDCVHFAAACVEAVTGVPPLNALRGAVVWRDERSALRALERGGGLAALAAQCLGAEVSPGLARPGDVGLFDEGEREALAVWLGAHWGAPGEHGLVRVRPEAVRRCWRAA